ncbi:MAG: hypothetical protein KDA21_04575, partial [Phycisphaerales bacterium]|nr:hypothetical protein [Phycisphaerales bacterium]
GKVLFWDEQLSSTRLTACGSCHIPEHGGADPRAIAGSISATHPGLDGILGTPDDTTGSPGVPLSDAAGAYLWDDTFGIVEQITPRMPPSMINAAYAPLLFWDGRAEQTFVDPITGMPILGPRAALESQTISPPVGSAEMGHVGRDWNDVAARMQSATPLALAGDVPAALETWVNGRDYPQLFTEAFGTPDVTPSRIAMAIATYERTLFSNQAPIDSFFGGNPNALTPQELQGQQIFITSSCGVCHAGNRFTDDQFHYIGLRPANEDRGRFEITGNPADNGAFRTAGLRNVALRGPYFHNGRFSTLQEVVDFYDRGGDFNAPNKSPLIRPLGLSPQQKAALVAFLTRPLTDPRVEAGTPPFDRPTLYSESACMPTMVDSGRAGSGGFTPVPVALEAPRRGNDNMTVGVFSGLGGASAVLVLDTDIAPRGTIPAQPVLMHSVNLDGAIAGDGFASISLIIPDLPTWTGQTLMGRWYISDPGALGGLASSAAFTVTIFEDCGEPGCPGDVDDDRVVGFNDLNIILESWQHTVAPGADGDTDLNGTVNFGDLNTILTNWGSNCG